MKKCNHELKHNTEKDFVFCTNNIRIDYRQKGHKLD